MPISMRKKYCSSTHSTSTVDFLCREVRGNEQLKYLKELESIYFNNVVVLNQLSGQFLCLNTGKNLTVQYAYALADLEGECPAHAPLRVQILSF